MTAIEFDEIFQQMVQEEIERIRGEATPESPQEKSSKTRPSSSPPPQPSCSSPPTMIHWGSDEPDKDLEVEKEDSFLYFHNFISEEEEQDLMSTIYHEYYSPSWVILKVNF